MSEGDTPSGGTGEPDAASGGTGEPEAPQADGESAPGELVVVRMEEDEPDDDHIDQPAKLVRIATMVQRMLNEVRDVDLDKPSRKRLTDIYNRTVEELSDVLPGDLREELSAMVLHAVRAEEPPSQAELRVLHAQLVGWLEGLFHGIQASIASQQIALQEQLSRMRQQQALERGEPGGERRGGPYL
jgi:hypothetical protein